MSDHNHLFLLSHACLRQALVGYSFRHYRARTNVQKINLCNNICYGIEYCISSVSNVGRIPFMICFQIISDNTETLGAFGVSTQK